MVLVQSEVGGAVVIRSDITLSIGIVAEDMKEAARIAEGVDTRGIFVVVKVVGAIIVGLKVDDSERGNVIVVFEVDKVELDIDKLDGEELNGEELDGEELDGEELDGEELDVDELDLIEESSWSPHALRPIMGHGPKLNANNGETRKGTSNILIAVTMHL